MDLSTLLFLSSGLFLGWSLGANDASNVFGTAVASRMVRFRTAAILCSLFVVLGAVLGGAGAAHGLGQLGAVNALAGSFTVALSAAVTVYVMTKSSLPVSTSQAIVGAIVGWSLFSRSPVNTAALWKIVGTWIACPILGAVFAAPLYYIVRKIVHSGKIHLLRQDHYTRIGLILAGILASYSLGANNIGNVMGVFVSSSPFANFTVGGVAITGMQQLFLLGALAIAVGVFTYSKSVMMTVGKGILPLSPASAFVVVVAHSLVLIVFSSRGLQGALIEMGLPPIPLIPVSSSQAVVGAVIGIGMMHGTKGLRMVHWRSVQGIAIGWVLTPLSAAVLSFTLLFVVKNVFDQQVFVPVHYQLTDAALSRIHAKGVTHKKIDAMRNQRSESAIQFLYDVCNRVPLSNEQEQVLLEAAELWNGHVDASAISRLDQELLGKARYEAVRSLVGRSFQHRWQLIDALPRTGPSTAESSAATDSETSKAKTAGLTWREENLRQVITACSPQNQGH